ncbi:MAG: FAD-dependent oxidoreductase [Deltaproteobacteria bacterium]|nr:FAD-dependent oxidoreductase [Deltaproteobacteria bacterium]
MERVAFSSWNGKVIDNRKGGAAKTSKVVSFPKPKNGTEAAALMGWNGLVIGDPKSDVISLTYAYLKEARKISCGECAVCMIGIDRIIDIFDGLAKNKGSKNDLNLMAEIAGHVAANSKCGFGQSAIYPVMDALKHFKADFEAFAAGDRKVEKKNYRVSVTAPCMEACPAKLDIPGYIELIKNNKFDASLNLIRENCILPGTTGRVCTHPCESACVRKDIDESLAIRLLKRAAADEDLMKGASSLPAPRQEREDKIAVIGAGPAGLAAAYNLRLKGYKVTIFEALPYTGGMAIVGIPEYRLPVNILNHEIELIKRMGVEIILNSRIDVVDVAKLKKEGYKAIFMAVGAHRGNPMGVEGEDMDCEGLVDGVEFLRDFNLGVPIEPKKKVIIVGGGNVAFDCARTCLRLGFKDVEIVYRRSRAEMPANDEEIEAALEEGINIRFLTNPSKIAADGDKVVSCECIKMKLGKPDESGRRRPEPVKGSEFKIDTEMVIAAIGQKPDLPIIKAEKSLGVERWGTVKVNPDTMMTNIPGLFAGGDCVLGPATLIEALDAGNRAAKEIDSSLQGASADGGLMYTDVDLASQRGRGYVVKDAARKVAHINPKTRIKTFDEAEGGFTAALAREEAARCLRCYRVVVWE